MCNQRFAFQSRFSRLWGPSGNYPWSSSISMICQTVCRSANLGCMQTTWHSHIGKLLKKIASGIGAIKRIRPFVSPEILHYTYNALARPHFDYCSIVLGNCGKTLSEKLQKLQNRAARILTDSSFDADARYLLQQLGWKDLITQRQFQVALMVFKALNDLAPDYLSSMFTERSTSGYVLRDSTNKLNVPLPTKKELQLQRCNSLEQSALQSQASEISKSF